MKKDDDVQKPLAVFLEPGKLIHQARQIRWKMIYSTCLALCEWMSMGTVLVASAWHSSTL